MKRYKKLCLEAEQGIAFEVEEGRNQELIIKSKFIYDDYKEDYYFKKYVQDAKYQIPPIPEGYKHICGDVYNGYVIERCSDGSQFVWVPVKFLIPDGTLDGKVFEEKFGRRYYIEEKDVYGIGFYEDLTDELSAQIESITNYGGFYISRFDISQSEDGKPQSVKGCFPWVNISYNEAKKVASSFENTEYVKSHLTFGAEYDSVVAWFFMAKEMRFKEITEAFFLDMPHNAGNWGEYIMRTGSHEQWCIKNIYDYNGNVKELTHERHTIYGKKNKFDSPVTRGGSYKHCEAFAGRSTSIYAPDNSQEDDVGFRIALYIK